MLLTAGLAVVGAVVAFATVRTLAQVATPFAPSMSGHPCGEACLCEERVAAASRAA